MHRIVFKWETLIKDIIRELSAENLNCNLKSNKSYERISAKEEACAVYIYLKLTN